VNNPPQISRVQLVVVLTEKSEFFGSVLVEFCVIQRGVLSSAQYINLYGM